MAMHLNTQHLIRISGAPGCFCQAFMGAPGRHEREPDTQNGLKIMLVAFDYGDQQVIELMRNGLQERFHAEICISHQEFIPHVFLDFGENQFNCCAILEWRGDDLRRRVTRKAGTKLLALTARDLYIPMLTFVFGLARLNGQCAVVSSCRLDNKLYGLPHDSALFSERLLKGCVHELGHTLGLIHCHNPECVMKPSTCVEQIDLKSSLFCNRCSDKLSGRNSSWEMPF